MTKEEFEQIIKPLSLLDKTHRDFIKKSLIGNFDKWHESKVKNLNKASVSGQSEQLVAFVDWLNNKNNNWLKHIDKKDIENFLKASNCH